MAIEVQAVAPAEEGWQVALATGESPEVAAEFEAKAGTVEQARVEIPAVPDGAGMEMVVAVSPVPAKHRRIFEHFPGLTLPIGQIKKKP